MYVSVLSVTCDFTLFGLERIESWEEEGDLSCESVNCDEEGMIKNRNCSIPLWC